MIVDRILIGALDEGREVTFSAADGPAFDQAVSRLTDGVDDGVVLEVELGDGGGGAGQGLLESAWIDGGLSGTLDPDFVGFEIGSITLVIDLVNFDSPGEDPNRDGLWTDYVFEGRVVVEGRLPAP